MAMASMEWLRNRYVSLITGPALSDKRENGIDPLAECGRVFHPRAMEDWKRVVEPYARPFFFARSRMMRGKTLGVRGLVVDKADRVLLIEHTYLSGWWLPGGGVETGETTQEAVARELREEGGIAAEGQPKLLSVHSNEAFFPGDHVLLFRVDDWQPCERTSHAEIKDARFFDVDHLPDGIEEGSLRRIQEAILGFPVDPYW